MIEVRAAPGDRRIPFVSEVEVLYVIVERGTVSQQTSKQPSRQADRQAGKKAKRQTGRQTDRKAQTHERR